MEIIKNLGGHHNRKLFSIITPCYNSSKSIRNVFSSLKNLNNQDFEWIVINDASTDKTIEILKEFLDEVNFQITIYNLKENKMATYGYHLGIEEATGDFIIFLDHDDQIKSNALDRFIENWDSLSTNQQEKLAGMIALCEDENGNIVGTKFPKSPKINNFFNMIFGHKVRGEKFFCYKNKVMKENNFQLVDRYVPESNLIYKISSKYETLFFNESLRVYNLPQKNTSNLSNLDPFQYSLGFRLNYLDLLNNYSSQLSAKPYTLVSFMYNFSIYSCYSKTNIKLCFFELKSYFHKVILFPIYIYARILFALKTFSLVKK